MGDKDLPSLISPHTLELSVMGCTCKKRGTPAGTMKALSST